MSPIRRVTSEDADPAAETTISPGADETTVIPPDLAATQARAYSDAVPYDDPDQPETQLAYYEQPGGRLASWGLAWGIAAAIVGVVALLAATVGLTAWALQPEPSSSTALTQMVPALPLQAMVPSTVTAAPPPVTVTAAPPSTVTVQAEPPEPPEPPQRLFTAAQEQQWVERAEFNGFVPTSTRARFIQGGEAVCQGLDAGLPYQQIRADVARNAPTITSGALATYITISVDVLCPDHAGVLP